MEYGTKLQAGGQAATGPELPHPLFDPLSTYAAAASAIAWGWLKPTDSDLLSVPSRQSKDSSNRGGIFPSYQLAENC